MSYPGQTRNVLSTHTRLFYNYGIYRVEFVCSHLPLSTAWESIVHMQRSVCLCLENR